MQQLPISKQAVPSLTTPCTAFGCGAVFLRVSALPQNLHGMPGLLGGFIAGIAAFGQAAGVAPHGNAQIGFQLLSLLCTVAIASTGGALVSALATGKLDFFFMWLRFIFVAVFAEYLS